MNEFKWENINKQTNRVKVPGGWFVQIVSGSSRDSKLLQYLIGPRGHVSVFFYPDSDHKWEV